MSEKAPDWLAAPNEFNLFQRFAHLLTRVLSHGLVFATIEGLDQPLPRTGPLIVVANHTSALDAPLITGHLAPRIGRPIHWMVKQELMDDRVLGPFVRAYGSFGVQRGAADTDAYRSARTLLDAGGVLASHPEGTRSRDGVMLRARTGLTRIAVQTRTPILPVGVIGLERFLPRGSVIPRPFRPVTVRFGTPFTLAAPTEMERRGALEAATTEMMVRIGRLLPQERWGAYAEQIRASFEGGGTMAGRWEPSPRS